MAFDNSANFSFTGVPDKWEKPYGLTSVYFITAGGGGGGNASSATGGGGAYVFTNFVYLNPDVSYNVIINVGSGGKAPPSSQAGGQSIGGKADDDGNYLSNGGTGTNLNALSSGGGGGMSSIFYMDICGNEIIKIIAGGGGGAGNNSAAKGGDSYKIGFTGSGAGGGQGGNTEEIGNPGVGGTNGGVNGYHFEDTSLNTVFTFVGGGGGGGGTFAGGGGGAGFGGGAGGRQGGGGGGGSYASPGARNAFVAGGGGAGGGPGQAGANGYVQILWNTQVPVIPPTIVSSYMLNSQHTSKSTFVAATRLPSDVQKYLTSSSSFPNSGVIGYIGALYIVSGDGKLYAFNTDFGVRWSTPFTAPLNYTFFGTPAISGNGTLYIAAKTTTSQNYLFAVVDKGTGSNGGGALKWQVEVDGNSSVSPVLDLSGNIYIGTDNGSVYAILDGSIKGQVLWKYPSTAGGFPVTGTPTFDISYNRLCFTISDTTSLTSSTSTLYVVDLSQNNLGPTQTERWFYTFNNDICGTPSINDKGIIYVNSSAGNVYAFDSSSNSPLWNLNVGDTNLSSIAIDNNKQIYFTSTNAFNVVDSSNGRLEWVYPVLPTQTLSASATVPNRIPTIDVSNNVYFGSLDSHLYSINTTNRAFNWRYKTGGAIQSMPIINNKNSIYFGSSDGYIYDLSGNGPLPTLFAPIAPMYMVNPQHTGQSPYIGPSSMPSLVWSPATFVSSNLFVLPTISIGRSDNSHDILYLGANNGRVYALNSLTGLRVSQFWPVNLLPTGNLISPNISSPDSVYTTPVIAPDKTIYVGTNEGLFYALNPSGSIKWYKILPFPLQSSPILDVSSGTIYLGAGSTMYAFGDAGNQAYPKWLVPFDTSNNITSSPALGNGFLTFGSADGYVYALNSFTGSLLWKYNTNAPIYASPTVDASNNVLIGNGSYQDGGLFYLNGATGLLSNAWAVNPFIPDLQPPSPPTPTTSFNGPLYNNVAVRGNTIYLSTMAYVYAINRLTGVERWQYFKANCYYTSPIIDANGIIYFSSIDARTGTGMVHSLTDTVTDFIENWVYPTNVVERLASPVLGRNNTLYLSSTANKIYALH